MMRQFLNQLEDAGFLNSLANNPLAQFGRLDQQYLGAQLLPERTVEKNEYSESKIRFRPVIANPTARHSPVDLKTSVEFQPISVFLAESGIGSQFTASDYDDFLSVVQRDGGTPSERSLLLLARWVDASLVVPLNMRNEKDRWDAIVNATITQVGDNNFNRVIDYPNPSGHRVAAATVWSNDVNDPYDDIVTMVELLKGKGYNVNRIVARSTVTNILRGNDKMKSRTGKISIASGAVVGLPGRLSMTQLNDIFSEDGIPPITEYNLKYSTQNTSEFFLSGTVMVFLATTGMSEVINTPATPTNDQPMFLHDTLGYTGIGRPSGVSTPGKVVRLKFEEEVKPLGIFGNSWQTSMPVIQEPEAIAVITGIS